MAFNSCVLIRDGRQQAVANGALDDESEALEEAKQLPTDYRIQKTDRRSDGDGCDRIFPDRRLQTVLCSPDLPASGV